MTDIRSLDLMNDSYQRLTENELANLGIVLGAYRSFRGNRRSHVAYVGMPITTGKRFYDVLTQEGVQTREELAAKLGPDALWELVIKPNIAEGIAFADELGQREDLLFIAPSVFEAKKWRWSQDAYMSLWYRVIGEVAGSHRVIYGWEYTDGGLKEVFFSMLLQWRCIRPTTEQIAINEFGLTNLQPMKDFLPDNGFYPNKMAEYEAMWKMRVFDAGKEEIRIDKALAMAVAAIQDLRERGFACDDLFNIAWKMMLIPFFSPFMMSDDPMKKDLTPLYWESREQLKSTQN